MKQINKFIDEIPVTRIGLEIYIESLEKHFKPIKLQYSRMNDLMTEAKLRLRKFVK